MINISGAKPESVILDVGAGTGNYAISLLERGYHVTALEPEIEMIKQCTDASVKWLNATVYDIPLKDYTVDIAFVVNAIHHFRNVDNAFRELKRVIGSGTVVIFTFDPDIACRQWFFDYWPELMSYERTSYLPLERLKEILRISTGGSMTEYVYQLPNDFEDLFAAALWRRPKLLQDSNLRHVMSIFQSIDDISFYHGYHNLMCDVESGDWEKRYSELIKANEWDVGCRLLKLMMD